MELKQFNLFFLMILLLFLITNTSALTYRTDLNNGTWSNYTAGLSTNYYETDVYQSSSNRDLETDFNLYYPDFEHGCLAGWCLIGNTNFSRYAGSFEQGLYSGRWGVPVRLGSALIFSQNSFVNDSNVSFYYKNQTSADAFFAGTISDSNVFTDIVDLSSSQANWTYKSFLASSGANKRIGFRLEKYSSTDNTGYLLVDDVLITRNNSGTFYKGSSVPYCSSVASCSNVTDANDLKSNDSRDLYWIVEYVSGAYCPVYEKGVFKGTMTEMTNGMYYYPIESKAYPSTYIDTNLSTSCVKVPYASKGFFASPRIYNDANISTTIVASNTLTSNTGIRGEVVTFWSKYYDDLNVAITDATCTLTVDGSTNAMTYNSSTQRYEYQKGFTADNSYSTTHSCIKENYDLATSTYSVLIGAGLAGNIFFTPISNISSYSINNFNPNISLIPSNNSSDIIFSVINNSAETTFTFDWLSSISSNKQYFVYSSTDGNTWVFSDSATFGSSASYNDPVQKIPLLNTYSNSFSVDLPFTTRVYYKLVLSTPPLYWETIGSSINWFNQNPTTLYEDVNGKNWDLFSDSNYSNVQSYTREPYQDLVSSDFTTGYELQFTAFSSTAGNLSVGYRLDGVDSVVTVPITTTPTRFSVPIAPTDRDAQLIIKSSNTSSNAFYLTDYALLPRSYFISQLEIINSDYTILQAILRNGVSEQYVLEGAPVRIKTSAYDSSGDLTRIEIQTLLNGIVVKDQFFPIASSLGSSFNFAQLIDGVIDLNGLGGETVTSTALRQITYKAVLWNSAGESVSEQFKTVSILQYPYFPNDLKLQVEITNTKIGTNPSMQLNINQAVIQNFLGFAIAIYDGSHSLTSPNYSKIIYANELGCVTLKSCTKQLVFNDYVWEGSTGTNFVVQVTALLSTENKNYTDAYANVTKHAVVSTANYNLGQFLQYYERKYAILGSPYKSTEKIPLVLGLSDDSSTSKDLSNTVSPYFTLSVDTDSDFVIDTNYTTQYYPDASAYDETTGITYWLWNQYLYKDNGDFFDDGNNVFFHVVAVDKRGTQGGVSEIGFSPRCVSYPTGLDYPDANYLKGSIDIFGFAKYQYNGQWLYNLFGSLIGTVGLNGCLVYPDSVVGWDGNSIQITDDYVPSDKQAQALYCGQKYGDTNQPIDQLGEDFECVLFLKEDEEAIDGVNIQIGNSNSDYSVTNENKQYIEINIPQTDIIFTDLSQLIRNWNSTGSPSDQLTAWDVLGRFAHDTLPYLYGSQLDATEISKQYKWSQAIGGDTNFNLYSDFNNSQFNKVVVFKVSGLSVINAQDYITSQEANQMNMKQFLSYANTNDLGVSPRKATITIYNNSSNPYKVIETVAPIVINKAPSQPQQVIMNDGNIRITTLPESLPFHVISTMSSANQTKNSRLISSLYFQLIIKPNPQGNNSNNALENIGEGINGLLYGKTDSGVKIGLLNNPMGFMMYNWFWILVALGLIIVSALVIQAIKK